MNKTKIALFVVVAVIIAVGLVLAIRSNTPGSTKDARGTLAVVPAQPSTTRELDPFTRVASIPATVDPATIRFEKLKMVDLASKTQTITDANCKERQSREPDGSSCDSVKVLERVKALEANYSFIGPQSSTGEGEISPTRQTFAVYFRPDEVAVDGSVSKLKREQAESLFQVTTSRPIIQEKVVDKQNSRFCEGNYMDGNWVQTDPNCKEQLQYTTRTAPSAYWAVAVDPRHPKPEKR